MSKPNCSPSKGGAGAGFCSYLKIPLTPNHRMNGKSRGFAFVTMGNRNEGQAAINALEGQFIDGRNLTVSEARPKNDDRASGDFQRRHR
ncbi:MAG: RNA-binding protein [Verrucomicrobia bacterium]|nr:RNA-binding protein [Verrucomicrobiota bacterium]